MERLEDCIEWFEDCMDFMVVLLVNREAVAVVKTMVGDVIAQLNSATRARVAIMLMVCEIGLFYVTRGIR